MNLRKTGSESEKLVLRWTPRDSWCDCSSQSTIMSRKVGRLTTNRLLLGHTPKYFWSVSVSQVDMFWVRSRLYLKLPLVVGSQILKVGGNIKTLRQPLTYNS